MGAKTLVQIVPPPPSKTQNVVWSDRLAAGEGVEAMCMAARLTG
jgi:hypothetical protein